LARSTRYAGSGQARRPVDRFEDDETAAIDTRVAARALGATLGRSLAAMRSQERDVLLLVAWADLTYAEVAAALGIPIGTVRSRLARARRQIRRYLPDVNDWSSQSAEPQVGGTKGVVLNG
jgi:RNA polymerase sigma factor (sigma-70 family)